MSAEALLQSIEGSTLAAWMRDTSPVMPVVEATHVLAAVMLLGTVLIVDLRLLGLADMRSAYTRIGRDALPLTWIAFGVCVATGALMFTTSAHVYFANVAFRFKALALLGAGLNMALFQLLTARAVGAWDSGPTPSAARAAGVASAILWAAVVLLGRWIGFTKGYDFTIPPGVELTLPG